MSIFSTLVRLGQNLMAYAQCKQGRHSYLPVHQETYRRHKRIKLYHCIGCGKEAVVKPRDHAEFQDTANISWLNRGRYDSRGVVIGRRGDE